MTPPPLDDPPPPPSLQEVEQFVIKAVGQPLITPAPRRDPVASVVLSTSASAVVHSRKGIFQLVGVPANEEAQVTVHFAPDRALQLVDVQVLDGGSLSLLNATRTVTAPGGTTGARVVAGTAAIDAAGTLTFNVRVGQMPGIYQVRIERAGEVHGLQFWVFDPLEPRNNPPCVIPLLASQEVQP